MSGDKPDFEGEGPEKMMRELMAQFKQSQGLPTPYYVVKREELVAHLAERADFWRSEVEEIKAGHREIPEEVLGIGISPRLSPSLQSDLQRDNEAYIEEVKKQVLSKMAKEAHNKARTFAFLSKHVAKSVPEFGVDLHAARVLELVPSDLHSQSYLVGR